jgi:N-carbamoyl-L-amino-acid hydrolase
VVRDLAKELDGFATVGSVVARPGFVTAIAGECEISLDQRNFDADVLALTSKRSRELVDQIAADERVTVEWQRLWEIPPIHFHPALIDCASKAVQEVVGQVHQLPSGPLHDAAEMTRAGIPTAMLFVQSIDGISHSPAEDSRPEDLRLALVAFDRLASRAIEWVCNQADIRRMNS